MTMTRCRAATLAALTITVALLAASCGSAPKKSEAPIQTQTVEEFDKNKPPPDDPCYGQGGEPFECKEASDCCKGFSCSLDPERSHVRRYCLEG
jgi:hypothetical protein